MKQVLMDIEDLSDSKEVYGERPNPFLTIFIYSVLMLFVVAFIYSFIGKIDIVATASGMIRPNEQISTITSQVSGKVTSVNISNGITVKAGDVLLSIDDSEAEASLDALIEEKKKVEFEIEMNNKFIDSIQQGKNLFESDLDGEEYSYYVQYENYSLSLKDSVLNRTYDEDKVAIQIQTLKNQITQLSTEKDALLLFKYSVEQNKNLLNEYPEYSHQYELYKATTAKLEDDYQNQRASVLQDTTPEKNSLQLSYYTEQINGYQTIINSMNDNKSYFKNTDKNNRYKQMYQEYITKMEVYLKAYDNAVQQYQLAVNGGSIQGYDSDISTYYTTMLEGYNYYLQSVEDATDMFDDNSTSVHYRSLYKEYLKSLSSYQTAYETASTNYNIVVADATATEDEIATAKEQLQTANDSLKSFKSSTIASIKNDILQVKSNIAQINIDIGATSESYNITVAQNNMDSAAATIDNYKATTLNSLNSTVSQLENELSKLKTTLEAAYSKDDLLEELKTSLELSKNQQYLNTLTQIESDIQAHNAQIASCQNEYALNVKMQETYKANKDENNQYAEVSYAQYKQLTTCLNNLETLKSRFSDLNVNIKKENLQIGYATITAEQDGVVNSIKNIGTGDVLTAGSPIATIIPYDEYQYKVQIYVENKDIAGVEVGDIVRYNISALPNNQYGIVEGKVLSISKDTKIQDNQQTGYYLVDASIAKSTLTDKNGNEAEISVGMTVEAKIVTQQKRIIYYLLEKINLF